MRTGPVAGQAIALTAIALTGAARPALAQTAEQIIDRHIAAIGGRDAIAAVETLRYVRTVLNTEEGVTTEQSRRTFYRKRPYLYRSEDAQTGRVYIFDGNTAWSGQPAADSDSIQWEEASFVLRRRDLDFDRLFGSFINYAAKGHQAEYTGVVELDGARLESVRVTWKEGERWLFYFAPSTGLCYGFAANPEEPDNVVRIDDYRRVGDLLIPHRNTTIDRLPDGGTRVHERVYSDIELNIALSGSVFRPVGQQGGKQGRTEH